MASLLLNLDKNLSEGIHKIKCKDVHNDKICKSCEITYNICDCFLDYNKSLKKNERSKF